MDQEFRQAVGQIDPRVLYFPEPNTLTIREKPLNAQEISQVKTILRLHGV